MKTKFKNPNQRHRLVILEKRWANFISNVLLIELFDWDLFFGQCHFWSLKTVDLATIFGKHNQNWQVLVFLPLLCFIFWLCCCICDKFYIANHAVLVPHFTPAKSRSCHKTLFLQVWAKNPQKNDLIDLFLTATSVVSHIHVKSQGIFDARLFHPTYHIFV